MWINVVKNTVGYSESENRDEFIKGAEVMLAKIEAHYQGLLSDMQKSVEYADERANYHQSRLRTIANILYEAREQ